MKHIVIITITAKHPIRVLCCLFICFKFISTKAQTNLVPNGSFEQYTDCPYGSLREHPDFWYQPDKGGGGYLNVCGLVGYANVPYTYHGYQNARTGGAFVGMFYWNNDANNYFQIKLSDSLQKDKYYYVEFYAVATKKRYKLVCNNVSILLTKQATYADTANGIKTITANPQITNYGNPLITDTSNWTKVSGIFKAEGGEQYLTLGNFRSAAQTSYIIYKPSNSYFGATYFVDDVSLIPLDSFCLKADAGKDTAITLGDSVFIGSYTNGIDSLKWQIQNTNTTIDSTRPGFWVHPTITTSYVLQQVVNGCFSADTVVVTVNSLPLTLLGFSAIYQPTPSPSKEGNVLLQLQTANEINVSHFNIQRSVNGRDFIAIGKVVANNKNYTEYRYTDDRLPLTVDGGLSSIYYRIESVDKNGKKQYSETRILNLKPQTLNGISIFPNPAKEQVTITCNNAKELMIIDYLGRVVYSDKIHRESYNINLQSFSNGLYLVMLITSDNYEKVEKLIKQ